MKIGFDVQPSGYFRADAAALHVDPVMIEAMMMMHRCDDPSQALAAEIEREMPGAAHRHPLMVALVAEANKLWIAPVAGRA